MLISVHFPHDRSGHHFGEWWYYIGGIKNIKISMMKFRLAAKKNLTHPYVDQGPFRTDAKIQNK